MKVRDIIEHAAEMLCIDDITPDDTNYRILFRVANVVLANIASNYLDCVVTQTFTVKTGKIDFSQFTQTFLKVKTVKQGSVEVPYELYINFLTVPNGKIEVIYACVPSFATDQDDLNTAGGISYPILLYGMLTEYALISGMTDEAKSFGDRFESLLFTTAQSGRARVMP